MPMIKCPSCGEICKDSDVFCISCGSSLEHASSTGEALITKQKEIISALNAIKKVLLEKIPNFKEDSIEIAKVDFKITPVFDFEMEVDQQFKSRDGAIIHDVHGIHQFYWGKRLHKRYKSLFSRNEISEFFSQFKTDGIETPQLPDPAFPESTIKRKVQTKFSKRVRHKEGNATREIHCIPDLDRINIFKKELKFKISTTISIQNIGDEVMHVLKLTTPVIDKESLDIGKIKVACGYCSKLADKLKKCHSCKIHTCKKCAHRIKLAFKTNTMCPNPSCIKEYNLKFQNIIDQGDIDQMMIEEGVQNKLLERKIWMILAFAIINLVLLLIHNWLLDVFGNSDLDPTIPELTLISLVLWVVFYLVIVKPINWRFKSTNKKKVLERMEHNPTYYYL